MITNITFLTWSLALFGLFVSFLTWTLMLLRREVFSNFGDRQIAQAFGVNASRLYRWERVTAIVAVACGTAALANLIAGLEFMSLGQLLSTGNQIALVWVICLILGEFVLKLVSKGFVRLLFYSLMSTGVMLFTTFLLMLTGVVPAEEVHILPW